MSNTHRTPDSIIAEDFAHIGVALFVAAICLMFGTLVGFLLFIPIGLIIEAGGRAISNYYLWVVVLGQIVSNNAVLSFKDIYRNLSWWQILPLSILYEIVFVIAAVALQSYVHSLSMSASLVIIWMMFAYGVFLDMVKEARKKSS